MARLFVNLVHMNRTEYLETKVSSATEALDILAGFNDTLHHWHYLSTTRKISSNGKL